MVFCLRKHKGMTLVEALICVVLISLISISIYQALSGGMRIWKKNQDLVIEEGIVVFFDKLESELDNAFEFSRLKAEGASNKIIFPTLIKVLKQNRINEEVTYAATLGQVEYGLDVGKKAIYRRQANYGQAIAKRYNEPQWLVKNIETLEFHYFFESEGKEVTQERFSEILPLGLEVVVEFSDQYGARKLTKVIMLPGKL